MYLSKKVLKKTINYILLVLNTQLKNDYKNNIFLAIYIIKKDR